MNNLQSEMLIELSSICRTFNVCLLSIDFFKDMNYDSITVKFSFDGLRRGITYHYRPGIPVEAQIFGDRFRNELIKIGKESIHNEVEEKINERTQNIP